MQDLLERIFRALQERGVRQGFQLIVRVGAIRQPTICLWAIKPPVGLGDSTTLRFEAGGPVNEAAVQVLSEIGVESSPNLGVLTRYIQRLLERVQVERFSISFSHYPGYHGPKIWLSAKGISISSCREDFSEALAEVFSQLESRLAAFT